MTSREADIRQVVGGHFTPDALSPEVYNALVARIKAAPVAYLDTFDAMYLANDFDAKQQSELYLPTFLQLVASLAPDRVRATASNLLKRYDAVMTVYDDAPNKAELFKTIPEETMRFLQRLEARRQELRALARQ